MIIAIISIIHQNLCYKHNIIGKMPDVEMFKIFSPWLTIDSVYNISWNITINPKTKKLSMKKIVIICFALFCATQTFAQCVNLAVGTFYPKANTPGAVSDSLQLIVSQCNANTYNVYNNGMLYAPGYTVTVTGTNPATNTGSTKVAVLPAVPYLFQVKTADGVCFSNYVAYPNTVLAVKLLSFNTAVLDDKKVSLRWRVENDQDADHYKLERSPDGLEFKEVGLLFPKNVTTATEYSFTDQKPIVGVSYYRLKMVNINGKVEYSSVSVVHIGKQSIGILTVMPNPAQSTMVIQVDGKALNGAERIRIFDMSGKVAMSTTTQNSTVDVQKLSPGVYMLEVTTADNKQTTRTTIVRQ